MATQNTGNLAYKKLIKVTIDGNESPLDDNNMLCSTTGLPQSIKENLPSDPDYVSPIYDLASCPMPLDPYTPKWVGTTHFCVTSVTISENTGYKGYTTLLKVTDDINEFPLDINNNLCSVSGLPQASKSNTVGQPDYIAPVYDVVACPLPTNIDPSFTIANDTGSGSENQTITVNVVGAPNEVINFATEITLNGQTLQNLTLKDENALGYPVSREFNSTGTVTLSTLGTKTLTFSAICNPSQTDIYVEFTFKNQLNTATLLPDGLFTMNVKGSTSG